MLGQIRAFAEDVPVWVYHNFPPYVVAPDEEVGISYDLAQELTRMSNGKYQFHVEIMPRRRLNYRLKDGTPGIVFWGNPAWFGDPDDTKFLWSAPILGDKNVVISPKDASLLYRGPQSLVGMTLIGVRGHRYLEIDTLVEDGLVDRLDLSTEAALIQFIAYGRGQVAIVAESAAQYFVQRLDLADDLYFSDQPHSTYYRHILVLAQNEPLHAFIDDAIAKLSHSSDWQKILARYGFGADLFPQNTWQFSSDRASRLSNPETSTSDPD